MKKLIYLLSIITLVSSCENDYSDLTGGNSNSGWIEFNDEMSSGTDLENIQIPINVALGTNATGMDVGYSVELISGDIAASNLGNFSVNIPADDKTGYIDFTPPISIDGLGYELKFTLLTSSNNDYQIGLSDGAKITSHILTVCPFVLNTTYTGDVASSDIGLDYGVFPPFTVELVPVEGEDNTWFLDTTWGPDFVYYLTGGGVNPGDFPYPSTLTLNADGSVIVTGDEFYTSGGDGSFCNNTFTLNLTQGLFTTDFTVQVTLIGDDN